MNPQDPADLFWHWMPSALAALAPVIAIFVAYSQLKNTQKVNTENRSRDTFNAKEEILERIREDNSVIFERIRCVEIAVAPLPKLIETVDTNSARLRDTELAVAVMRAVGARSDRR